jgi:hypothetical protein
MNPGNDKQAEYLCLGVTSLLLDAVVRQEDARQDVLANHRHKDQQPGRRQDRPDQRKDQLINVRKWLAPSILAACLFDSPAKEAERPTPSGAGLQAG